MTVLDMAFALFFAATGSAFLRIGLEEQTSKGWLLVVLSAHQTAAAAFLALP